MVKIKLFSQNGLEIVELHPESSHKFENFIFVPDQMRLNKNCEWHNSLKSEYFKYNLSKVTSSFLK